MQDEKYVKFNPFLDPDIRFEKMIQNYKKFGSLVIGVDFDFTVCCPITGKVYSDIIKLLQKMQSSEINFIFCIWTANENPKHVKQIWEDNFLEYHYYNYSPINPGCIKPHFNILLDDSAGLFEAVTLVERIIQELQPKLVEAFDTSYAQYINVKETSYAKRCRVCDHLRGTIYKCSKGLNISPKGEDFVKCNEFEGPYIKTIKETQK